MSLAFSENDIHPQSNCNCLAKSLQIVNSIPNISNPLPPSLGGNGDFQTQLAVRMPLGEILDLGRRLVRHWQILNGCPDAISHKLGTSMLRSLADSAARILRLYELAVEHLLNGGGSNEEVLAAQTNSDGSNHHSDTSPSLSRTLPFGDPIVVVCIRSPTYLGSTRLDSKEEDIVAFEALRQSSARLGEILRDVEADVSQAEMDVANVSGRSTFEESTTQLFRLLAKFSNSDI